MANRFQLNFKRNVGPTSASIRNCQPKNIQAWRTYYYKNVKSEGEIERLGKILYERITTKIKAELNGVTQKDCIEWMKDLVINRVYEGYEREIQVIKGVLQEQFSGREMKAAPDDWDRHYAVDYYLEVSGKYVGIQIKPLEIGFTQQVFARYIEMQRESHDQFTSKYGGKVFYIFSAGKKDSKEIQNPEVIDEIKREIDRLSSDH